MDDLISRQALYKKACDYERQALDHIQKINPDKHEELVAWSAVLAERTSFKLDVRDAPSAQQWIPCSERLPDEDGDYIVTDDSGGAIWVGATFFIRDDEGKPNWGLVNVTAWMPLPEPYKGESNG